MTKVDIAFQLTRPLDETLLERIAGLHSVYGMLRVQVTPSFDGILVEYDASRLTPADVEAELRRAGIPAVRKG